MNPTVRIRGLSRLYCVGAVLVLLGELAHPGALRAQVAIAPDKVERLDWVRIVQSGGCCLTGAAPTTSVQVINETPDPCGASALYALGLCLAALGSSGSSFWHNEFSTQFRPNNNDSLIFAGLSSSFFTGYHSTDQLKTIMSRKPVASAKLDEFDQGATTAGTMRAIEFAGYLLGLVGIVAGLVTQSETNPNPASDVLLYGGLASVGVAVVLGPTGEYINCSAFRKLPEAVSLFNTSEKK